MELTYDSKDDVYEPFIVKIDSVEYKLQFPLTTEKLQKYWNMGDEAIKKSNEGEIEGNVLDEMLNFMLGIPLNILKKIDHRFKAKLNISLSAHTAETEKKNPESSKQSK